MSELLPCLSEEREMAAIANHSDSCHAAELNASCWMTITFLADLWKRGDCSTDCSYTYRQTQLSLVIVTWLIKISDVALTVAYLFLICNRTGRGGGGEGNEENYWLIGRRGGTDPTCVLSLPFTASYISLYFCPLVMPVQL